MLLTCDIGNTNITCGIWDGEVLTKKFAAPSNISRKDEMKEIFKSELLDFSVDETAVASVVPEMTPIFVDFIKGFTGVSPFVVTPDVKTGLNTRFPADSEIGADRLCNAAAAVNLYGFPVLIADFGTATTFDIIDIEKEFIGGIIAPGVKLQADSLYNYAAQLPKIDLSLPRAFIGRNTVDEMLSGIVNGHAAMVEKMLENCKNELGYDLITVATGGYSSLIYEALEKKPDFCVPDLTLSGLKELYKLNAKC